MSRSFVDEDGGTPTRKDILKPFIQSSVSALGGFQNTPVGRVYEMGDSCLGCLKDLKKFWRKDDTDDERTVARIFWEVRVLPNDLINIVLETAGKGMVEDKRAIACADLVAAMTWPIDVAEELRELDDEVDTRTDYATLIQAQLAYKASLLRPNVLRSLMDIMAGPISKSKRDRTERDSQIINVILHLFRNLAFVKDLPMDAHASSDQAEYSSLQSKLISTFQEIKALELFLFLSANAPDSLFNPFNALVLEIFYLLFRGVGPEDIIKDPTEAPGQKLSNLLKLELKNRSSELRSVSSRHSRFGTTVAIRSGKDTFVMHKQRGLFSDASSVMDLNKKKIKHKMKKQDELASFEELSSKALSILRSTAISFLESCFGAFFSSLLKDIKAERPKITEQDNIRLLRMVNWFIQYFVGLKRAEITNPSANLDYEKCTWRYEMVSEVVERSWMGYVLKRIRISMDDKPKQWTELRAGMDCLSTVLSLLDLMAQPPSPDFIVDSSSILQHQMYYNGEILDVSFECLRQYKEQSIAYLDSAVNLAYILLRMLEKWAMAQGQMVVRKAVKSRKKTSANDENGPIDEVSDDDAVSKPAYNEHMFTFEKFEGRFAQEDITRACLAYLGRWREFDSPDKMKRIVSLLHRQAVRAKAEGLFFKVSTLELFNRILAHQKDLPRERPYKDLLQLINFVLRKFFKTMEEQPLLMLEAFFPKNRGAWKQYSTWKPLLGQSAKPERNKKRPVDVEVKKGWTDSEKLGIAIMCLIEDGRMDLIDWIRSSLMTVLGVRLAIMNEVDGITENSKGDTEAGASDEAPRKPSAAALQQFENFPVACVKEEQATAATKDPHLKLVLRLIDCQLEDPEADEFQWYFPAAITPDELQHHLDTISKYLETPLELEGKKASDLLRKQRATRRRRGRVTRVSDDESGASSSDDELAHKKRRAKRKKEEIQYKSAEMIYDSDAELGDDEEFYKKEAELRQKTQEAAQDGNTAGPLMLKTGTKKRKRKPPVVGAAPDASSRKKSRNNENGDENGVADDRGSTPSASSHRSNSPVPQSRPRPRPRPRLRIPQTSDRPSSPLTSDNASPSLTHKSSDSLMTADDRRSSVASLLTDADDDVPSATGSVHLSDIEDEGSGRALEWDRRPGDLGEDDERGIEEIRLTTQVGPRRRHVILSDSD